MFHLGVGERGGEEAHARGGVAEGVLVPHELQLRLDVDALVCVDVGVGTCPMVGFGRVCVYIYIYRTLTAMCKSPRTPRRVS